MGGHWVAMAGKALLWACATAAGVAVAFCNVWVWAALPPPNMLPIEQPASTVAAAAAAVKRRDRVVKTVISKSPNAILDGAGFKGHQNSGRTAGANAGGVFEKDRVDNTIADDHGSTGKTLAHAGNRKILGQAKRLGQCGVAVSDKVNLPQCAAGFSPGLHDVMVIDRSADDTVDTGSLELGLIGEEAGQMIEVASGRKSPRNGEQHHQPLPQYGV